MGYSNAYPVCSADGTTVKRVNLFGARLTGTLPDAIGAWVDILLFDVHANTLSGAMPPSSVKWRALTYFDISNNHFSGEEPLPALPFSAITSCGLLIGANAFQCPWPAGATAICDKWSNQQQGWVFITDADCTPTASPTPAPRGKRRLRKTKVAALREWTSV